MCALPLALDSAGNSMAARMAMMAITTNNSINVNAPLRVRPSGPGKHREDAGALNMVFVFMFL